ncbi:MAG: NAD-dependent epimerase/dehydratase family protein, partial [Ardenticatenaceae bacterium]
MVSAKKKVLVTGASGLIGGLVLKNLADKYAFSALNRRPVQGVPCTQADIADFDAILPAFEGIHTVLHLAGYTDDVTDWEGTERVNIKGTYNVYEAARIHGVRRIIFASSGGTMLGYELDSPYTEITAAEYNSIPETWPMITHDMPARPVNVCYVSKLFGEALGRMCSDLYGISVINIRFGAVLPDEKPILRRHYPGYLSHADAVQMVERCIDVPEGVRYDTFDAISNNR